MIRNLRFVFFLAAAFVINGSANANVTGIMGPDQDPKITGLSPVDDANQVEVGSNLTIIFDVRVQKGAGDIVIKKYSDNAVVETIDVNGGNVSIVDSIVTIDPVVDLAPGTHYYIQIDGGAFVSLLDVDFAGIPDNVTWDFTTIGAPEAPTELTLDIISSTEIDLTWIDNSDNETEFKVLRSSASDFSRDSVTISLGKDITTYNDNTLSADETYYYQVSAVSGDFSVPSNIVANVVCAPDLQFDIIPYEKTVNAEFSTVSPGDEMALEGSIINKGDCKPNFAAQPTYEVFLSEDDSLSGNDVSISKVSLIDLKEGEAVDLQGITIPDTTQAGDYYLIIQIDPDQFVYESDESNNTYTIPVSISSQIDIKISNFKVDSVYQNQLYVTFDVVNLSDGPVGSFEVDFKSPELPLGNIFLTGIPGEDTLSVNRSLFIPCGSPEQYSVIANLNSEASFVESNTNNNKDTVQFTYAYDLQFRKPDLIVTKLATNVNTINVGETITVTSSASNGDGNINYFLSQDQFADATDIELGTSALYPATGPCVYSYTDISENLTIPVDVTLGNYYLLAVVDYDDTVDEEQENNNTDYVELLVSDDPDLVVSNVVVTNSPDNMGTLSVTFDVTNQGMGPVGESRVNAYLSDDNNFNNGVIIDSEKIVTIPELTSAGTFSGSATFELNSCTAVGNKYVFVKADYTNVISEENEENNTNVNGTLVTIGDVPDFGITHISGEDSTNDNTILANFTIRNNSGTLKASSVKFYLSNDVNLGASDIEIKSLNIPELACSDSTKYVGEEFTLPEDLEEGKYIIIAAIDRDGVITETNEQNNSDFLIFNKGGSPLDPKSGEEDPGEEEPTVCGAPTGLNVTSVDVSSAVLTWDNMGADDYLIWISEIGTAYTNGASSYAIDNLSAGATFSWSVKSICKSSVGTTLSRLIPGPDFTTDGENACSQAPTNLEITNVAADSVTLVWDNMGVSDYLLWVSSIGLINTTNGSNSYTIKGLTSGATYSWAVKSICSGAQGTIFSTLVNGPDFTTDGENPCSQGPTNLEITNVAADSVTLTWDNMGASDYQIWVSSIGVINTTDGSNRYTIKGLTSGATYSWAVKSRCVGIRGTTFSSLVNGPDFTLDGAKPCAQPPIDLTVANIDTDSVTLNWKDMGVSDYLLWVSDIGVIRSTGGSNSYTIKGLTPGTKYSWSVKSICRSGSGTIFSTLVSGPNFTTQQISQNARTMFSNRNLTDSDSQSNIVEQLESTVLSRSLTLYPNPSIDEVTISLPDDQKISTIIVMDSQGTIVKDLRGLNTKVNTLRLREYGAGIYVVQIITNDNHYLVGKIIIQ